MNKFEQKIYVGVDVSKNMLDIYILPTEKFMQFKNSDTEIKKLINKLQKLPNLLIVMESTGGYEKPLAHALFKANLPVAVVNPRQVRDFAKALGKLAKTDKLDAKVIALFAAKVEPRVITYHKETHELSENNARRRQLIEMIKMEKNRLDKSSPKQKESIRRVLEVLEKELEEIDQSQAELIAHNAELTEKKDILASVKGIGLVTASSLLATLPELGNMEPKQLSALVGVAPLNRDSGTLKGKRTIWGGRASVRDVLYMPTLVAIKHNPQIRAFYERLCANGKAKMTAVIACMHKLLIVMNALIRKKEMWLAAESVCYVVTP